MTRAWPTIIADIGFPKLRQMIMTLRYAYAANYCGNTAELADKAKETAARVKRLN
jgi:hypothetical protein